MELHLSISPLGEKVKGGCSINYDNLLCQSKGAVPWLCGAKHNLLFPLHKFDGNVCDGSS